MTPTTYKIHPSKAQPEENLGPENIASSPEALLLAAVIRQAVEDYGYTEEAVAHHTSRKDARRLIRRQPAAEKFLFEELEGFLNHFDVSHLFHRETIVRKLKKTEAPVARSVEPTRLATPFAETVTDRWFTATSGAQLVDRYLPANQQGRYS